MSILRLESDFRSMVAEIKDSLIAPEISNLKAPAVPDISADRKHLLELFISNDELSLVLPNKHRQLVFNIVRKAEDAFDEYCNAATNLTTCTMAHGSGLRHYFSAVRHFEHCLAHLYQAVCCMNSLAESWGGEKQFDRGDGSILERAQIIHTQIKHMNEKFAAGDFCEATTFKLVARKSDGTRTTPNVDVVDLATLPLWLTNDGLECAKANLTYVELGQEIRELHKESEKLASLIPPHRHKGA